MLKKPAVSTSSPSSAPVNWPGPSSEGWVGAPGAAANPTNGARRYGIMDPRRYVNPNAFGEQPTRPRDTSTSGHGVPPWQKRWLVATTPGVLVVYKRANRLGGPVGFVDPRTRPSWSPTGATRGSSSWSPALRMPRDSPREQKCSMAWTQCPKGPPTRTPPRGARAIDGCGTSPKRGAAAGWWSAHPGGRQVHGGRGGEAKRN